MHTAHGRVSHGEDGGNIRECGVRWEAAVTVRDREIWGWRSGQVNDAPGRPGRGIRLLRNGGGRFWLRAAAGLGAMDGEGGQRSSAMATHVTGMAGVAGGATRDRVYAWNAPRRAARTRRLGGVMSGAEKEIENGRCTEDGSGATGRGASPAEEGAVTSEGSGRSGGGAGDVYWGGGSNSAGAGGGRERARAGGGEGARAEAARSVSR